LKRHINTVHRKAKIPCPVGECLYSRNGPRRGISRQDALRRHLISHGMSLDQIAVIQKMETMTAYQQQHIAASTEQESSEESESLVF